MLYSCGELLVHVPTLIPDHQLLSPAEARKIAKKYNSLLEKFPKIQDSDPQAKKLGARPGDMIAIKRNDPTGSYTYYRLVVKG